MENDAPAANASVAVRLEDGSAINGITDSTGKFKFTFVPPYLPRKVRITATCDDCINTAASTIDVKGSLTCERSFGNPIQPATNDKVQVEADWQDESPDALSFQRIYRSANAADPADPDHGWTHSFAGQVDGSASTVRVRYGNQINVLFHRGSTADDWVTAETTDRLKVSKNADGSNASYLLNHASTGQELRFDGAGLLKSVVQRNGKSKLFSYDASGRLLSVVNSFGRQLSFDYGSAGQLSIVKYQNVPIVVLGYDGQSRLVSATYPDGTKKQYGYGRSDIPFALTSIVDEAGVVVSSFDYDELGRTISTARGAGTLKYSVEYAKPILIGAAGKLVAGTTVDPAFSAQSAAISSPLGGVSSLGWSGADGRVWITSASGSVGGIVSTASQTFNTSFLKASESDFKGVARNYDWDLVRRLIVKDTRAVGLKEVQTTTTQWHATFNLPVLVTETGRTTAYTYDTLGNRLTETVTDTDTDTATGEARTRRWTYDAAGLVATATEPNGAVTAFVYDDAGNVARSTDALGRVTTYAHDAAGRLTRQTDPTGLVTQYAYDLRGRLLTQDRGGLITSSTYTPTGLVSHIAYPGGYAVDYVYDPAHRLTGWRDNRGASGSFTLDGMGNRTAEETRDAQGALAWQVARSINQINRVDSETLGADRTVRYTYDANGERVSETNALGQTTQYGLDGLRRVQQITDSLSAQATLAYDPRDNVVSAADFKGVPTSYTRDAQGSATQERSADIGALATTYDALGLPRKIVDALGRATDIARDALGRPIRIAYADGSASVLGYDLAGADFAEADAPDAGIGFLGELQDPGVATRWRRDALGRVTRKQQLLADGGSRSVGYGYVAAGSPGAGQIASITYPSGGVLGYVYDATGQLSGLTWNGTPLVNNLTWSPLGQPTGWQWPFVTAPGATGGLAASRRYDTAGQLVQYELGSYTWDAAGRVASLTQELMLPTVGGVAPTVFTTGFTYDGAGRIVGMAHEPRTVASLPSEVPLSAVVGPQQIGMAYDANGNRRSVVYTQGAADSGLTLQRTYSVAPDSNRLTGYAQTLNLGTGDPTVTQVPFTYDATGSITQAGQDVWGYGADGRLRSVQRSDGSGDTSSSDSTAARATYVHNALGQRVVKTDGLRTPALRTETVYAEGPFEGSTVLGQYRSGADGSTGTTGTGTTEFIYLPTASGPMPIAAVVEGRLYAVHSDHLHTPRRLTREDGQVAWQWVTTAFGEVPPSTAETGFVQATAMAASGGAPSSSAAMPFAFDLRYPGQVADEESGVFYNYLRSYDPATGRYTQNDPIGLLGGWSRYGYGYQNPLTFIDPDGLQVAIPAPALAPIAGSLARPATSTLIDPVVTPGLPDPNDPNNYQKCQNLKKRINNLREEIYDKRYPDLLANPGNLPQRIGPGEALRDTVRGHEKLLNRQLRRLRELEGQHDKECIC